MHSFCFIPNISFHSLWFLRIIREQPGTNCCRWLLTFFHSKVFLKHPHQLQWRSFSLIFWKWRSKFYEGVDFLLQNYFLFMWPTNPWDMTDWHTSSFPSSLALKQANPKFLHWRIVVDFSHFIGAHINCDILRSVHGSRLPTSDKSHPHQGQVRTMTKDGGVTSRQSKVRTKSKYYDWDGGYTSRQGKDFHIGTNLISSLFQFCEKFVLILFSKSPKQFLSAVTVTMCPSMKASYPKPLASVHRPLTNIKT